MKKIIIFIIIAILAITIGFLIGGNILNPKKVNNNYIANNTSNITNTQNIEKTEDANILTSFSDEKISVNTEIVEETYYNECNHKIEYILRNKEKYMNMTEEELKQEFPSWEIKEFSKKKVVLYKEEDDFCNEHFLVKDEDGYVTIYTINNEEEILELLDKTDIATKYLAQIDQENLKKGMIIYTKQNLNKLIEDFE